MYVLKPEYYDKFHCIGDKCNYTCCQGWEILVETNLYEKYEEYLPELKKTKEENAVSKDGFTAYKMPLNSQGMCPFCNKEQLCSLVIESGEEMLSYTCQIFPRESLVTSDTEEKSLSPACPQVVQLMMELDNPITFVMEEDDREVVDYSRMSRGEREKEKQLCERINFDVQIRDRIIDLMQNRQYPLWFRQFACIYVLDKIKEMHGRDERELTLGELEKMFQESYLCQLFTGLNQVETDKQRKFMLLQYLSTIFNVKIEKSARSDKDRNDEKVRELIELNANCDCEAYIEACELWEKKEKETFDILMEHVLVCDWFRKGMMSMNTYYFYDNCLKIILEQLLIRHNIMLYYTKHKTISRDIIKFIVSLCSRSVSHAASGLQDIIEQMKDKNIMSIDNIFLLLK